MEGFDEGNSNQTNDCDNGWKINVGGNPVTAASDAAREGIVVNAIGIVSHQRMKMTLFMR